MRRIAPPHTAAPHYSEPAGTHWQSGLSGIRHNAVVGVDELLRAKREEILRIAARHGAHNVRVFGSVARGGARQDSDVDFLVEMEKGRSLFDLGGLLMDLQEFLDRRVDVITEKGLRDRIRSRVLREAVAL